VEQLIVGAILSGPGSPKSGVAHAMIARLARRKVCRRAERNEGRDAEE
jgi:hypothetical protein